MPDRRHPDPAVLASDVLDRRDFLARVGAAAGFAGLGLGTSPALAATEKGSSTIPIGAYRGRHRIPEISWPLYAPVYARYVNNYPPSLFTKYLPPTLSDAAQYLRDPKNRNWK